MFVTFDYQLVCMRNYIFILFLFCYQLGSCQQFKVMTFNIRLSLESDKENAWTKRKDDAMALMAYYHPDILGVQEALPQQMRDIQAKLTSYKHIGVGRDDGKDAGEYSAIFYDHTRLKVLESGTFWLSETPEVPSKGWDAAYPRICTYGLFKDVKSGKKFWALNLHFDHVGNIARVNSSQMILDRIKKMNPKNYPLVLTGDFNLTEDTAPIQIMSKSLDDTFYHTKTPHYGPKATWQAFDVNAIAKDRIDYIFVKGFQVLSNRTVNDRRTNNLYPSDHFPVMAEITLTK